MLSAKGEVLITHAFPSLHPNAGLHYFSAGGVREWEGGQVGLERKGRRKWVWSGERLEMRDRTRGHMEREVKGMKCERREREGVKERASVGGLGFAQRPWLLSSSSSRSTSLLHTLTLSPAPLQPHPPLSAHRYPILSPIYFVKSLALFVLNAHQIQSFWWFLENMHLNEFSLAGQLPVLLLWGEKLCFINLSTLIYDFWQQEPKPNGECKLN